MKIKAATFAVSVKLYQDQPMSGSWAKVLHKSGDFFVSRSLEWWDKAEWEKLAEIYDPNRNPIILFCGTEHKEALVGIEQIFITEFSVVVKVRMLNACNLPALDATRKQRRQLEEQQETLIGGANIPDRFTPYYPNIIGAYRSILDQSGDIVFSDIPEDSHAESSELGGHEWKWMKERRTRIDHLLENAELIEEIGKPPYVRLDDGESSKINENGIVEFTFSRRLGAVPRDEWTKFKVVETGEIQDFDDDGTTLQPCRLERMK